MKPKRSVCIIALTAVLCSGLMAGCTSVYLEETKDPYESINRSIFSFNRALDRHIIKPVAKAYDYVVPLKIQKNIGNFFSNLNLLPTIANDILQANLSQGISDTARFCFNSTLGIFGLFDATKTFHLNLPSHYQDLGLTLAKFGAHESPYVMMPLFGPKTMREVIAMPISMTTLAPLSYLDNSTVSYSLQGLEVINYRTFLLGTDKLVDESLDPYVFVRNAYLQDRRHAINQLSQQANPLKPDNKEDDSDDLDQDLDMDNIEENEEAFMDQLENDAFLSSYQQYRNHYHPSSTFHLKDQAAISAKPTHAAHHN